MGYEWGYKQPINPWSQYGLKHRAAKQRLSCFSIPFGIEPCHSAFRLALTTPNGVGATAGPLQYDALGLAPTKAQMFTSRRGRNSPTVGQFRNCLRHGSYPAPVTSRGGERGRRDLQALRANPEPVRSAKTDPVTGVLSQLHSLEPVVGDLWVVSQCQSADMLRPQTQANLEDEFLALSPPRKSSRFSLCFPVGS